MPHMSLSFGLKRAPAKRKTLAPPHQGFGFAASDGDDGAVLCVARAGLTYDPRFVC